jgi:hypothetical protein
MNGNEQFFDKVQRLGDSGTGLIAITTLDPGHTTQVLFEGFGAERPRLRWDSVGGFRAFEDDVSRAALSSLVNVEVDPEADPSSIVRPMDALAAMANLPENAVVIMYGMHRWLSGNDASVHVCVQALWNLRDEFKMNGRMALLLVPDIQLPADLVQDVVILDQPLPSRDEIATIIREVSEGNEVPVLDDEKMDLAVGALRGLAYYPVESAVAAELRDTGVNVDGLWDRKRQMINQTPGLSVWVDGKSFDDVGGYDQVKSKLKKYMNGRRPIRCFVFLDEIDKGLAGAGVGGGPGDNTGASQGLHQSLLEYMEDNEVRAMMFLGASGSGKTMIAQTAGNEAGVVTIKLDLGGMKGSLLGQTEQRIRTALKVVDSISDGQPFFIATCNRLDALSPEIQRRFRKGGTFFFELPQRAEREAIWPLYLKKYEIDPAQLTDEILDMPYTGAEIRNICEAAYDTEVDLAEAAQGVIPVAISGREDLQRVRAMANDNWLSASHPGAYKISEAETVKVGGSSKPAVAGTSRKRGVKLPNRKEAAAV